MYQRRSKRQPSCSKTLILTFCSLFCVTFLFIFVTLLSHNSMLSEEPSGKAFVFTNVNSLQKEIEKDFDFFIREPLINLQHASDAITPSTPKPVFETSEPEPVIAAEVTKEKDIPYHSLSCPHAELLTFWKKLTLKDKKYKSPFTAPPGTPTKYVTFEPDVGGWNNIRMQMELVLVFAYASGRTLVLPPDQPMYLLNKGKGHQKAHSFADFFPFDYISQRLPVISMEEFMKREAVTGKLYRQTDKKVYYPPGNQTVFDATEKKERLAMWDYLRNVSTCPLWRGMKEFLVFPPAPGVNTSLFPPSEASLYDKKLKVFAATRSPIFYDDFWQEQRIIHFISKPGLGYRLLEHFYTFIHFQDDRMDRYYKRFVRDYIHYIDIIFCKAAIIINNLLQDGDGSYSSFHIRRGEFQYKEVKIPAKEMMENIGEYIPKGQLLFIATDEKNKSFFNDFHKFGFPRIRFLDDYMDLAQLRKINPNFLGMIDQVVCTRGEIFVGTWFSTFSGYITRMRGYLGYNDKSNFYGDKVRRFRFQKPELPKFPFYMREWNVSWDKIDNF